MKIEHFMNKYRAVTSGKNLGAIMISVVRR